MAFNTYDPKEILVIVGIRQMTGFADGTGVKVSRNEDAWTVQSGVTGETARSKNNNRTGSVEISLLQTAEDNQYLSDLALLDENANAGAVPLTVKDNNGNTILFAENAWVKKMPDVEYGKEAGPRTWVFETDNLVWNIAGN